MLKLVVIQACIWGRTNHFPSNLLNIDTSKAPAHGKADVVLGETELMMRSLEFYCFLITLSSFSPQFKWLEMLYIIYNVLLFLSTFIWIKFSRIVNTNSFTSLYSVVIVILLCLHFISTHHQHRQLLHSGDPAGMAGTRSYLFALPRFCKDAEVWFGLEMLMVDWNVWLN